MYFDAMHNRHYGKMVNESWLEDGNNCMIKWNPILRRAEVWTLVDVPLYKELGAAYNDPYWYRPHNGITTRAQAVQIRDYYNKTELPRMENVVRVQRLKHIQLTQGRPTKKGRQARTY